MIEEICLHFSPDQNHPAEYDKSPRKFSALIEYKYIMLTLNLGYVLKLTTLIFCSGALGLVLNRKNILVAIMCIELFLRQVFH